MYKLLKINGIGLPDPSGEYSVSYQDIYNEYETENGKTIVEVIRENRLKVKISFIGQKVMKIKEIAEALKLVSQVEAFDPSKNDTRVFDVLISNVDMKKVHHRGDLSVWSLSFDIKEL